MITLELSITITTETIFNYTDGYKDFKNVYVTTATFLSYTDHHEDFEKI